MTDERARISDPAVMRALAHPARLVIMEHLALNEEIGATATECAEVVGLTPSATSYHLRALARAGMIEEAPSRGDGRERVWRRRFRSYEVRGKGENRAEELAMAEAFLAHQNDKIRRYLAGAKEDDEWHETATMTDNTLVMTTAEVADLIKKIDELIVPFQRQERAAPPKDARIITFQLRAVPLLPL